MHLPVEPSAANSVDTGRRMRPGARRALLELALQDLVAFVREVVERNSYGDGRPAAPVAPMATALERFERLGGFDALRLALWSSELDEAAAERRVAAGCGAQRTNGPLRQAVAADRELLEGPAASGALRRVAASRPRPGQARQVTEPRSADEAILDRLRYGGSTSAGLAAELAMHERSVRRRLRRLIRDGYAFSPQRGRYRITAAGLAAMTPLPASDGPSRRGLRALLDASPRDAFDRARGSE